jgi:UDP-N-acetylglucosamine 2-epimerase (non-hydrolysing)
VTTARQCRLLHVVGARPNFVKMAPVIAAADGWNSSAGPADVRFRQVVVHTGQHYDPTLSRILIDQLGLPEPDEYLGVGPGSHAVQTARLLEALEPVIEKHRPDLVLVPGDVNTTLAGALVAAKLGVPVAHLEAGLRSGDRAMPEEINRIVVDHLADLLFTTCEDGDQNLRREGIPAERVRRVGNTMIDTLHKLRPAAEECRTATQAALGLPADGYVLVTLHRPSNVDSQPQLSRLLEVLATLARDLPVVFPVHPRTRKGLAQLGVEARRDHGLPGIIVSEPLGYVEFLGLMTKAAAVITDSGGIQEETTAIGVPCVTVRTTTERPLTVAKGTNHLVDPSDPQAILAAARAAIARGNSVPPPTIELWDGHAGERVVQALGEWASA